MTACIDVLQAAGTGDLAALAEVLDRGCDPDVVHPETGATALYNACFAGQVEAAQVLLARGADPNKRITYRSFVDGRVEGGVVALMLASSIALVEVLLRAGADPAVRDDSGRTVLMRLVGVATPGVFALLIRSGADPTARAIDGRSAADVVRKKLEWWRRFAPDKNPEHQADLREILAMLEAT